MPWLSVILASLAAVTVIWAVGVVLLIARGRRSDASALARFIPDCLVLFKRLLADPRIPRRHKALLVVALGYLALPFDLVPDFIPVAGQLDDAVLVALVLRTVLRSAEPGLLAHHWPGPPQSLAILQRATGT